MPYAFASELKDGYLHVRVRGPNDAATIRRYIKDTLASALRHSCPNVLVEENLEGAQISMGDVFQIVSDASANAKHEIHRIAFVDTNPRHTHANMKFAETVAVNRGMGMTVFATVADAEKWMRAKVAEPLPPPKRKKPE